MAARCAHQTGAASTPPRAARCAPSTTRRKPHNPATEILETNKETKKKGFSAPRRRRRRRRRAARPEYSRGPALQVRARHHAASAPPRSNTLNDLPETVATATALERAASAFFLAEYLARFYSRGFDARRGPVYYKSSRGLMDTASPPKANCGFRPVVSRLVRFSQVPARSVNVVFCELPAAVRVVVDTVPAIVAGAALAGCSRTSRPSRKWKPWACRRRSIGPGSR